MKYIIGTNIFFILLFGIIFALAKNFEFIIYVGVIIFFATIIGLSLKKIKYPKYVLWGLTIWAVMHMAGGGLYIGTTRLYDLMLIPIVGDPFHIFKYDQLVHMFGFAVTTAVMHVFIKPKKISEYLTVFFAGMGAGALNEVVEFMVVVIAASTGVGGYYNTALDLCFNLIGAGIAILLLYKADKGNLFK